MFSHPPLSRYLVAILFVAALFLSPIVGHAAPSAPGLAPSATDAATCTTLQPDPAAGKDSYIYYRSGNTNYGSSTALHTDSQFNRPERTLIEFDLSSIPAGSTVMTATLELYMYQTSGSSTDSIEAHRITSAWDEATVTWNSVSGGQYDAAIEDAVTSGAVGWKRWDLQSLVSDWHDGTVNNYGLMLLSPSNTGNNVKYFYSSDYTTDTSLRPKLTICYDTLNPELTVTKSMTSPSGRTTLLVGESATFEVVVENTGDTEVVSLPLQDVFDNACLAYSTKAASPAESSFDNGAGTIDWTDLTLSNGVDLAPGERFTTTILFDVVGTSASGSNTGEVAGAIDEFGNTVPTVSDSISFTCMTPGSLEVTKTVDWNGVTPDTGQTFEICVSGEPFSTLTSPATACQTADYDGETLTWTGLIPGDYTVTETAPGSEWTVAGNGSTVTVPTNGSAGTGTITNTRKLGSISATKVVDWNGVTPDTGQTFELCISGPTYPGGNCQSADYDGETLTWNNLIPGDYTLTETSPGSDWTVSGDDGAVLTVPTDGGSDSGTITNTRKLGSISATKVVDWNGVTPDTGQTFELCISGPTYPGGDCQSADYDGETLTWNNLIPGDYTLTETSPGSDWTVTGDDGATLTVPTDGGSDSGTITNTRKLGSISATKVVDWNGVTPDTGQTFELCISGPTYPSGDCQNADYDGETLTWNNLIPGDYTLTETSPGSDWTVSGDDGATLTVPTDGGSDSGTITNTHTLASVGDLVWNDLDADGEKDGFESGLEGLTVELHVPGNTLVMTTTTAADGTYSFADIIPVTYFVRIELPPDTFLSPKQASGVGSDDNSDFDPTTAESDQFTLSGGDVLTGLDAGIYCKQRINGMVFFDSLNQDGNHDNGEPGIGGVQIRLFRDDGNGNFEEGSDQLVDISITTVAEGSFFFANVAPGNYFVVETNHAGFGNTSSDVVNVAITGSCPVSAVSTAEITFADVTPTAVTLADFTLSESGGEIAITWSTSEEIEQEGFVIWRALAENEQYKPVSDLIAATNNPGGATYQWTDSSIDTASSYWYTLQSLPDGEFFGPIVHIPDPGDDTSQIFLPFIRQ